METLPVKNITPYLELNEQLLWAGQPKKGFVFEAADIFKTLFVIALAFLTYFATNELSKISLFLAIPVGVLFYSACILLGIGRFYIDAALRKRTFYGLTSNRIIIKTGNVYPKIQSVYLNTKPKIDFLPNLDNTATIDIGLKSPIIPGKTSFVWIPNAKANTTLYRLIDANIVHQKIKALIDRV